MAHLENCWIVSIIYSMGWKPLISIEKGLRKLGMVKQNVK
jgi:hypothetical protein